MRHTSYRTGDVIITAGAYTSDAYLIRPGFVEVYRAGPPEQRLSVLGPGDIFGEMSLITERPRSASVRALEDVQAQVFDRATFLQQWRSDPDSMRPAVTMLCERIRILDALVLELAPVLFIEGITPEAARGLDQGSMPVSRFPFRIGRKAASADPFSANELALGDEASGQVSLNHCAIVRVGPRYFLIDRGSRWGTIVNGVSIGGRARTGCVELKDWDNEIALGEAASPYRLRLTIVPPETTRP
jgi:hypothetical protein